MIEDMPYSIWAIEELEVGMQIMREASIDEFMTGKLSDKEMSQWEWDPYIRGQYPKFHVRDLFEDEYRNLGHEVIE
jgi:hypothetical protein